MNKINMGSKNKNECNNCDLVTEVIYSNNFEKMLCVNCLKELSEKQNIESLNIIANLKLENDELKLQVVDTANNYNEDLKDADMKNEELKKRLMSSEDQILKLNADIVDLIVKNKSCQNDNSNNLLEEAKKLLLKVIIDDLEKELNDE